jgi:hypothetical protein
VELSALNGGSDKQRQGLRPDFVIGPLGERLTLSDLPDTSTRRWIIRRKAEVISAVRGGLLSPTEACERYRISPEEFAEWQRAVDHAGIRGLRATYRFWSRPD